LQGMVGKDEHTVAFLRMAASQMRDLADYARGRGKTR
jgi:ribosomal protein S15P/S13E